MPKKPKKIKVPLSREAHKKRHKKLHKRLDELLADYMKHMKAPVLDRPIIDLLKWSNEQCENPTE